MDKPTIIITPEGANPWYDMYLDKLLNWAEDELEGIEMHNYGYVVTRQGVKMVERVSNVVYVKFD